MPEEIEITYDIYIGVPARKVWKGLVDAEFTNHCVDPLFALSSPITSYRSKRLKSRKFSAFLDPLLLRADIDCFHFSRPSYIRCIYEQDGSK